MPAEPQKSSARPASLQRILRLARPELGSLVLGTACAAVSSAMNLLVPKVIGGIVDRAMVPGWGWGSLRFFALGMVGIALVGAVASGARMAIFTVTGERIVAKLRADLFARLMEQDIAFFDDKKTGELTNRLASDTTVLQNTVSVNISMALRFVASIVGGIGFLFFTSPKLTLLMLAVVPPIALGAVAYGRRVRKLSRDVQDALAGSSEVAEEALAGIRTVRAFTAEPSEVARYAAAVERSFDLARARALMAATFMGVASFAAFSALAAVL